MGSKKMSWNCIPPGCSNTKLGIFTFSLFHYFGGNTMITRSTKCLMLDFKSHN